MSFQTIHVPDAIAQSELPSAALELIDRVNESIESFMLANDRVIENFVTCDFHLVGQALMWIHQNQLCAGDRFCELGSGVGGATLLAAMPGPMPAMESVGIEIEPELVDQSILLADSLEELLGNSADFFCGSFVPRDDLDFSTLDREIENVVTDSGDVFDEIGLAMDDFDLFFAFPWPGESSFFETVVDQCAANGALLLTYGGREGMKLLRKI
ncbi:hypothetical protein LF1_03020 [Rubripirellula obstinata]|uniref:Methyltransferase n=1 Tax=Rubripirellula obstinata TaxID=406547 RepID=A0A5B1CC62_9BACT|nr:hypothetical protein [Rubripirellula obstinata]KAA1257812.1 hypothetical protein LF1_03020 [Rubripirellula obstinata]